MVFMTSMTRQEVAKIIEDFIEGTGDTYDWGDFLDVRIREPELEVVRRDCTTIPERFPQKNPPGGFCNEAGVDYLRGIARRLREQ